MAVAALIVALVATAAAVVGLVFSRRAVVEARRSADAAAETARIERDRRADELADAERRRVVFELHPLSTKGRHLLRHAGTDVAYGVRIDPGRLHTAGPLTFDEIAPGLDHAVTLSRTMGPSAGQQHVEIFWHLAADQSDPEQSAKLLVV